jgi:nicotinate-nucleotide pyrophosphorylase (carboxylating)
LIKDNHITAAGSIGAAVARARARAPHTSKIEVVVTGHEDVDAAREAGAEIVLLDNFTSDQTREAVAKIAGRAYVELSGNMTLDRIAEVADLGADAVSVGALTHSAPAADISLRLYRAEDGAPAVPRPA